MEAEDNLIPEARDQVEAVLTTTGWVGTTRWPRPGSEADRCTRVETSGRTPSSCVTGSNRGSSRRWGALFEAGSSTFASGAVGVVVELDPETLSPSVRRCVFAHDSGQEINPKLVEGQVHGGYAHGLGYALFEDAAYGPDSGMRATTFLDYAIVTAAEVPVQPEVLALPSPTAHNPEGFKGAGESGAVPIPAAVANALEDALHRLGRPAALDDLPITPDRLFRLLHGPGAGAAG